MTRYRMLLVLAGGLVFWWLGAPALAATPAGEELDTLRLAMGLFGGLALFLYGMDQMSEGLKAAAGESLKVFLAKLTTNRVLGAITGAFVTAVLNSSSVTTVLVVGFVTAGFMSLAQSVGVIMDAWVGFISYLAEFVVWLSPSHPEFEGTARMAVEVPRQIANAHTVFNVANTLLFLGFTTYFARLVERLVPE